MASEDTALGAARAQYVSRGIGSCWIGAGGRRGVGRVDMRMDAESETR